MGDLSMSWRRWLMWGLVGLLGVLLIIQLVPYGRAHENPPVVAEPAWDTTATRDLVERACYDCHSNETVWPWYTYVAPISWLTQHMSRRAAGDSISPTGDPAPATAARSPKWPGRARCPRPTTPGCTRRPGSVMPSGTSSSKDS